MHGPVVPGADVPAEAAAELANRLAARGCRVTAQVPDDSDAIMFGIFLIGQGRIELRNAELSHSTRPSADRKTSPDHGVQADGPAGLIILATGTPASGTFAAECRCAADMNPGR